jgi:hypothetical protein
MTSIFIVRAENGGCPESYIYGVYPTVELALARVKFLATSMSLGMTMAWYDEVKVGANGADCQLANR